MSVFVPNLGFAAPPPELELSYQGRILHADGTPVSGAVDFQIQIRSPLDSNCLMFEEERTVTIPVEARGAFSFNINGPGGNRTDPALYKFEEIFSNRKPFAYTNTDCAVSSPFNPEVTSARTVIVSFSENGTWETLPTMTTAYTPQAIEALGVGGYGSGDLLRVDRTAPTQVVNPFTHADYLVLVDLVAGKIGGKTLPTLTTGQVLGVDGAGDWLGITPLTSADIPTCLTGEYLRGSAGSLSCATISGGSGSVTSVGITVPPYMTAGAAITTAGDIALDFSAQAANTVFAGPTAASGAPSFRTLNIGDIKSLMSGNFFAATGACTSGRTLTYSSVNDAVTCEPYSITNAQALAALGFTPVNVAGDVMSGALGLPANGLTVGTSQLVASGGNIGIGTTAPSALLHIENAGYANQKLESTQSGAGAEFEVSAFGTGAEGIVSINASRGTKAAPTYLAADDRIGYYAWGSAHGNTQAGRIYMLADANWNSTSTPGRMSLQTTPTGSTTPLERMVIDSNGTIGIGTDSPQTALDVVGTGNASAIIVPRDGTRPAVGINGMIRYNTGTHALEGFANGSWQDLAGSGGGGGSYLPLAGGTMSGAIDMGGQTLRGGSAASASLTLDSTSSGTKGSVLLNPIAGNVGIGTTAPTSKFSVAGVAADNARFFYDNANLGGTEDGQSLYVYRKGSGGDSYIRLYNDQHRQAHIVANGNGNLFIETSGLYMKTASFGTYSSSSSSAYLPNLSAPEVGTEPSADNIAGGLLMRTGNSAYESQYGYMGVVSNPSGRTPTLVIGTQTGASSYSERMRISTTGNVGIGTTNPGEALVVQKAGSTFVEARSTTANAAGFHANAGGSRAYNTFYAGGATAGQRLKFVMSEGGSLVFAKAADDFTSEVYQMVIGNSGNVGIGTTTPATRLDVVGTGDASAIIVPRDGTRPTTGVNGMIRYNTGTNSLEAFANGSWSNLAGAGGGGSFLPLAGGTMSGAIDMGGQRINGGSGAGASLTLDSTSSGTKGNIVLNPSGGAVIIGNTTPDANLDVEDSIRVSSNTSWPTVVLESGNTDTNAPTFVFKGTRTNGSAYPNDGNWLGDFSFRNTDNDSAAKIYVVSTENQNVNAAGAGIGFQTTLNGTTTPVDRLFIDHSGYVGIGTTDPTSKFSVAGAATDSARFFYDNANVGASDTGQSLYVYRREAGGDSYIRLYNDALRQAHFAVSGNGNLFFDASGIYMTLPSPYGYGSSSTSNYLPNMGGPLVGADAYGSTKAGGIILQTGNTTHRQFAYMAALANDGSRAPSIVIGGQTGATAYDERMRITPEGNVGIGTTGPAAKLDVSGSIRIADDATACSSTNAGAIKYTSSQAYICNGTSWAALSQNATAGALYAGFPDMIRCSGTGGTVFFHIIFADSTTVQYTTSGDYGAVGSNSPFMLYNAAGTQTTHNTSGGNTNTMTSCNGRTIAQLQAANQTFTYGSNGNGLWSNTGSNVWISSGNVGIGTNNPGSNKLQVTGQLTTQGNAFIGSGDGNLIQLTNNGSVAGSIELRNGATSIVSIPTGGSTGTGNVGIGSTAPSYKLDVNGTIRGVGITDSSDIRLKREINPLETALERVLQLEGVTYFWKDEEKGRRQQIGLIAQDVEKAFPELVETDKEGMKSVNYSHLVSPLIEAVKELYERIMNHDSRIAKLEMENARLLASEKQRQLEIRSLKARMAIEKAESDARFKNLERLIRAK